MAALLRAIDAYQREHTWLGFPIAVVKKFGDDRAGSLAALLAYYGFLSLFPLLLALVSLLSLVLEGDPALQQRILDTALGDFPVLGDQIRGNLGSIDGSGLALAVGLAGALWGGLGVTQTAQDAMNAVWNVPYRQRPNFLRSRARSLGLLALLGGGLLLSTAVASLGTIIPGAGAVSLVGSLLLNCLLFLLAFQLLTALPLRWMQLVPGAVLAGVLWAVLQAVGSLYVSRQLSSASALYGVFGTVIGLLAWLSLGAQAMLYAAELNCVRARRLWPRSLTQPLSQADRATLSALAQEEARRPEQSIEVSFDQPGPG